MIVISYKTHKARKEHVCDYCCCKIPIGEVYKRSFNIYDNQGYTWKSHLSCEEIANILKMFDECDEGLTADIFQEHIREEFVKLQEHYNSDVFNYGGFEYPNFEKQLEYVCSIRLKENF